MDSAELATIAARYDDLLDVAARYADLHDVAARYADTYDAAARYADAQDAAARYADLHDVAARYADAQDAAARYADAQDAAARYADGQDTAMAIGKAMASLDISAIRNAITDFDAAAAGLADYDVVTAVSNTVATFDTIALRNAVTGLTEADAIAVRNVIAGLDSNRIFADVVSGIEGSEADRDRVARQISEFQIENKPLSRKARLAIAAYFAFLTLSICAWVYLVHPAAAKCILDAGTMVGWSYEIAQRVYRCLSDQEEK
jgi:hypothetical protein